VPGRGLTLVIPAHEEAAVLPDLLASLARQDHDGPVQLVVAANACTDRTVEVATAWARPLRARGFDLEVVTTDRPSKAVALNSGDAVARFGHRVYVDADVRLSANALSRIAAAFDASVLFCSPRLVVRAASPAARVYARVWPELPYVRGDVIGAGVYAAHERGRARWDAFPDIIADDKFARLHFALAERRLLEDCSFEVFLPVGVAELVAVRSRWIRANAQLRQEFPELAARDRPRLEGAMAWLAGEPQLWPYVPGFLALYAGAEVRAQAGRLRRQDRWERATRSREARTREGHAWSLDLCPTAMETQPD
jgi:glycosyltransferase involved in cell wall biosynthesis